jgi:hypothetical protein
MHAPYQESFPQAPGLKCISDKFSEAYERQINGESPIHVVTGDKGPVEILALNPKRPNLPGDNARYLLSSGTLGFAGATVHIDSEEFSEEFNIEYGIIKIILPPDDRRPISELGLEDLALVSFVAVTDNGEIGGEAGLLTPDEQDGLLSSIKNCVLSTEPPGWFQE